MILSFVHVCNYCGYDCMHASSAHLLVCVYFKVFFHLSTQILVFSLNF